MQHSRTIFTVRTILIFLFEDNCHSAPAKIKLKNKKNAKNAKKIFCTPEILPHRFTHFDKNPKSFGKEVNPHFFKKMNGSSSN